MSKIQKGWRLDEQIVRAIAEEQRLTSKQAKAAVREVAVVEALLREALEVRRLQRKKGGQ